MESGRGQQTRRCPNSPLTHDSDDRVRRMLAIPEAGTPHGARVDFNYISFSSQGASRISRVRIETLPSLSSPFTTLRDTCGALLFLSSELLRFGVDGHTQTKKRHKKSFVLSFCPRFQLMFGRHWHLCCICGVNLWGWLRLGGGRRKSGGWGGAVLTEVCPISRALLHFLGWPRSEVLHWRIQQWLNGIFPLSLLHRLFVSLFCYFRSDFARKDVSIDRRLQAQLNGILNWNQKSVIGFPMSVSNLSADVS